MEIATWSTRILIRAYQDPDWVIYIVIYIHKNETFGDIATESLISDVIAILIHDFEVVKRAVNTIGQ